MNDKTASELDDDDQYDLDVKDDEELAEILERHGSLPFDVRSSMSESILVFGKLGHGDKIGKIARYIGGPLLDESDNEVHMKGIVGVIVGDNYGRVVLDLDNCYLGWLESSEYEILNVIPQNMNVMH